MSSVTCNVSPGYNWVFDADGKVQITLERLNLTAVPVVTANLAGAVAAADIVAGAVTAAKLADAVADVLIVPVVTVAAESSNNVDVSIQCKDIQGNNLALNVGLKVWLHDAAGALTPTATLPSSGAPTVLTSNGYIINPLAANLAGHYVTDATGLLKLRFTETGTLTRYISVLCQSKWVAGSGALIWT